MPEQHVTSSHRCCCYCCSLPGRCHKIPEPEIVSHPRELAQLTAIYTQPHTTQLLLFFNPRYLFPREVYKLTKINWKGMMLSPCSQGPAGWRVAEQHWNAVLIQITSLSGVTRNRGDPPAKIIRKPNSWRISLLLLLLLLLLSASASIKPRAQKLNNVKQRLQRLLIRCSLYWGRRPHSPAAELLTGVETERLFLWWPGWWLWCVCQSVIIIIISVK